MCRFAGLDNATIHTCAIYIHTYVHEHTHHWLNQAFAVAERYLANLILVHCFVKHDARKSPNYCALPGTPTNSDNDSKRIGAGMDILALPLAVIIASTISWK